MIGTSRKQSGLHVQIASRPDALRPAMTTLIRRHARKLGTFNDRIVGCRVMVETPHPHFAGGGTYRVRLDLTIPGGELVVRKAHREMETAIQDAFNAAERRLKDQAGVRRNGRRSARRLALLK